MHIDLADMIRRRVSTALFDLGRDIDDAVVAGLAELATRAPSAYNMQNWRLVAVRSAEAKARLEAVAWGQDKVADAAVTFIVCGTLPRPADLPARLQPSIDAGFMPPGTPALWADAAAGAYEGNPVASRDEAIRSGTLAAAFMIIAAEAHGLASCPMIGFDADRLASEFGLGDDEIPAALVAVGYPAPGNWPQKPRRPVDQVLTQV